MTQIQQIGANGGLVHAAIGGIPGNDFKDILGLLEVSGLGIVNDVAMVRGSGGGFFKGYSGPGFLSVSDGTIKLYYTTYCELVNAIGGFANFNSTEFTLSVWTEYPDNSNPKLTHIFKKCRIKSAPLSMNTQQVENLEVDLEITAISVDIKVG